MIVNGKEYPMWSQFVERANEFVGCTLDDYDMGMHASTVVTGITLEPNGDDSAYFLVEGEDFDCGFDVQFGGIGAGQKGYLTFYGYGGHEFTIHTGNDNDG